MATETSSTAAGAVNPPPSNDSTYAPRGVFNNSGTSAGTTGASGSSTSQTTVGPSTSTGGVTPNDATITLAAGSGLAGGDSFTTNQSFAETITFSLENLGNGRTFGDAADTIQTITIDDFGRVTGVSTAGVTPAPPAFNDNLQTSATFGGGPVPGRTQASSTPTQVTAEITVDASDYMITNVAPTGNNVENINVNINDNMATITGTVPANTAGPVSITTRTTVMQESTGESMVQSSTPLSTTLYVPYYRFGPATQNIDFSNPVDISTWEEAGSDEIRSGDMITFTRDNPGTTQQIYWAVEQVQGRDYMIDVGFGVFDFVSGDTLTTATRLGRTFNVYKFFSNGTSTITINF